jgi:MraZ protein
MAQRLLGTFHKTLDDKHRIVLPREFRGGLDADQPLFLVPWYDETLALFEEGDYMAVAEGMHSQGSPDEESRIVRQEFFGGASMVVCDKQGRMNLPDHLVSRILRRGEDEVVLVGDWNKVLIQSASLHEDRAVQARAHYNSALSKVEKAVRGNGAAGAVSGGPAGTSGEV